MSTQPADSGGDIVVSDQDLYDHATSDPAPAPSSEPAPQPAAAPQSEPQPQQPGVNRDDQGRFAPKQPGQQAATTQQPAQPQQPQQQRQAEDHRVPVATLLQERDRAHRAETELQQMRLAYAQWQQQLAQQQAAAQQQQAPQTIFDNPDDYLMQRVIAPLRQEGQMAIMQRMDGISRAMANREFTKPAVDAALNDLARIRQTPHGNVIFTEIMNDGHPYGALVEWHKQARVQQQIGRDPNAWLQQQQQAWFRNPQVRAAMLKDMQQEQQRTRSNGGSPSVQLPPSLSSMPSSSGRVDDQGDLSNESLYRFATR